MQLTTQLILSVLCSVILCYLLGSLSFAIIVSKCVAKKDIREFGSGNAGMTNVLRTLGKGPAALTLLGDIGKAVVGVFLSRLLLIYWGGRSRGIPDDVFVSCWDFCSPWPYLSCLLWFSWRERDCHFRRSAADGGSTCVCWGCGCLPGSGVDF